MKYLFEDSESLLSQLIENSEEQPIWETNYFLNKNYTELISIGYTGSTKSFGELKQIALHYKSGYKKANICLKRKCNEIQMNMFTVFFMSTVAQTPNGEE